MSPNNGKPDHSLMQLACEWLAKAQNSKPPRIISNQKLEPHRSQVNCGISVDYLMEFSKSLEPYPRIPNNAHGIVRHIITMATGERHCRFVDLVPKEHVSTATLFVSHSWKLDLHEVIASLYSDFERRYQIYLSYKRSATKEVITASEENNLKKEAAKREEMMRERRTLQGYYVWMDVFALQQNCLDAGPCDLPLVSRLITSVNKTVLMLDEENEVLKRMWCLWEVWVTKKTNRVLTTLGVPAGNFGAEGPDAYVPTDADVPIDPEDQDYEALKPLDLYAASATIPKDKELMIGQFKAEVASLNNRMTKISQLVDGIWEAINKARYWERCNPRLQLKLCEALIVTRKVYSAHSQPVYKDVEAARSACRNIIDRYFAQEAKIAKLLSDQDVEMELWECLTFLEKHLTRRAEDPFWIKEIARFAKLAHKSFASRFSGNYVDTLLHEAGTYEDMKLVAQYVHSTCRTRIPRRPDPEDDGLEDDGKEGSGSPTFRRGTSKK